jgi:phosphoribosylglycinamide formyltransferase 1
MMRVAVFASGSGSNFEAIAKASLQQDAGAGNGNDGLGAYEVALLVTDKPSCGAVARAAAFDIPVFALRPKDFPSREAYEERIVKELVSRGVDFIVLAGYMRLITTTLLSAYEGRIINIHPSLLPSFPGKNAIEQAVAYGVKVTGVTVHFVDDGMDTGPVIAQEAVTIEPGDTAETLAARIHAAEHRLYPAVVGWAAAGRIRLEGRQVTVER